MFAGVHLILQRPGAVDFLPVSFRREIHAAVLRQLLHGLQTPHLDRYAERTAGKPAEYRAGHSLL
ncbi:hypothetical protein SDC9_210860 [bioreactor metagenome]|uniref:Uncharacterized protein n=1 Tax=bioreactor metagenome TaxID=1076179 RepID=A0A645JI50_9ZZZZ